MTPLAALGDELRPPPPDPAPTMAAAARGVSRPYRSPRDSMRCRMVMYRGSRSFIMASSGEAMKIEE